MPTFRAAPRCRALRDVGDVTGELLTNTVEIVNRPRARVGEAIDDLRRRIDARAR